MTPELSIENLKVHFPITRGAFLRKEIGKIRAVDGVSLSMKKGEILGLVGESGSGKTTLGRAVLNLVASEGTVRFGGETISDKSGSQLKEIRKKIQIIFQDPFSSLDPRMTIYQILSEPLEIHGNQKKSERLEVIDDVLSTVGLHSRHLGRYPHEFSGGQRQRIAIARALILKPEVIIADEPVSALDVSIQAQILNLLAEISKNMGLTMIFISHDLAVVRYISHTIAVMYLGKIVELAPRDKIFENPVHPYTQALVSAVPGLGAKKSERIVLSGNIPSPSNPPSGCRFRTRCVHAEPKCETSPELREIAPDHLSRCHFSDRWLR